MCEILKQLAAKRGQPVKALVEMIRLAMTYLDEYTDMKEKLKFIETIKFVCDKKIYLEVLFTLSIHTGFYMLLNNLMNLYSCFI